MENKKLKTKQSTLAPPITVWFNGNNGQLETHEITSSTEKFDDYVGKEQFFATGPYLGSGPDVYGAVVQVSFISKHVLNLNQTEKHNCLACLKAM